MNNFQLYVLRLLQQERTIEIRFGNKIIIGYDRDTFGHHPFFAYKASGSSDQLGTAEEAWAYIEADLEELP
mgnify:CR=1 FL=1